MGEAADGEGDGAAALGVPPHPASGSTGYRQCRCWALGLIPAQRTHPRAETLRARCAGCASAAHHALPDHEPARVLHSSHSSLQLQPNDVNRQVLASISEAFIIGPSWLVVTRLVVEQLPSNAVRHPLVA